MSRRLVVLGLLAILGVPAAAHSQMRLVSVNPIGLPGNHDSINPRISADGLRIVFESRATDLVPGDISGKSHIYLWDARSSPPRLYRLSVDNANDPANGPSYNPSISPDGRYVAFNSSATDLGAPPTDGAHNVYVRSISGYTEQWRTTWVSRSYTGKVPTGHCGRPSMSNVGIVAFECHAVAGNMVPNDNNGCTDVFVATVSGTGITRVSVDANGKEANDGYSQFASIDAAGHRVAFESYSNKLVPDDKNNVPDIFVKELDSHTLVRVESRSGDSGNFYNNPDATSLRPAISGDGKFVAFESQATNLVVPSTTKSRWHVYRHDLEPGSGEVANRLISVGTGGYESPSGGIRASINHDGSRVAYEAADQVFVWTEPPLDRSSRFVTQVSRSASGSQANGTGEQAVVAPATFNRSFVTWTTRASNLDEDDKGVWWDVYVRPLARGVETATPETVIAVHPRDGTPEQSNVSVYGSLLGDLAMLWVSAWFGATESGGGPVWGSLAGLPQVTVGGVAATGVSAPDLNTLRFTAPALPAGSSNVAVIRYGDGEVVTLPVPLKAMALTPGSTTDTDKDTLPDWWELTYGLDPNKATDAGVVQANGLTPVQARAQQRHPTCTDTRYLAEGATGSLFKTRIALANPGVLPATALLRYAKANGTIQTQTVAVPSMRRATVDVETLSGMGTAEFSTAVESDLPLIVDRTLSWGGADAYGAHAETAVAAPAVTWYLAEGATTGTLNLFYLLQNPNALAAQVRVRYLRPSGGPIEKTYTLPPNSRSNIWVDVEDFPGLGLALANTDVSAVFTVLNNQPIIVERALYAEVPGQFFGAGHESAGITAPALEWFLAEGATGDYFDLFVLIANPGATPAKIEATYLLPNGTTLVKPYSVAANSRFNIWVDYEDAKLANTAVSTTIRSTNSVPVIVERALWWPGAYGQWYEAHNSPGATSTGTRFALAEGEVGGTRGVETYILLANTSTTPGTVLVTLLFENQATVQKEFKVAPRSRFNVDVRAEFPAALNKRFGAIVESLGTTPAQIVVERAMYWNANGQFWAAGTNALATKLQ